MSLSVTDQTTRGINVSLTHSLTHSVTMVTVCTCMLQVGVFSCMPYILYLYSWTGKMYFSTGRQKWQLVDYVRTLYVLFLIILIARFPMKSTSCHFCRLVPKRPYLEILGLAGTEICFSWSSCIKREPYPMHWNCTNPSASWKVVDQLVSLAIPIPTACLQNHRRNEIEQTKMS